jgi:type IV pilus assembly protein PilF
MSRNHIVIIIIFAFLTSCAELQKTDAADAQIQLGLVYLEKQDNMMAKKKFLLALQDAPHYSQAWDALAYYTELTGDTETAEKYYKKAIKLAPKQGSAHNNYGVFLCKQTRYTEALQQFNLALLDKNYLKTEAVYQNAGMCALKIPDTKLAEKYFRKDKKEY